MMVNTSSNAKRPVLVPSKKNINFGDEIGNLNVQREPSDADLNLSKKKGLENAQEERRNPLENNTTVQPPSIIFTKESIDAFINNSFSIEEEKINCADISDAQRSAGEPTLNMLFFALYIYLLLRR